MPEPIPSRPTDAAAHGVSAEAMRLFASITRHLQSLSALAGLEGREAAGLYVKGAIALGAALFFAAFGYVFLLLAVAFALDHFLHVDWVWIALGFAVLHLIGAVVGLVIMKKSFGTPVFRGTAEEIRRDLTALRPPAPAEAPAPLLS